VNLSLSEAVPRLLPGVVAAAVVVLLSPNLGGYYTTSWGWPALVLGTVAVGAALLRGSLALGRLDAWFLGGLCAFVGWIAFSAVWSWSPPATALEVQRAVVYLVGVAAILLLCSRAGVPWLLGGLGGACAGIALAGLATRLFPETFDVLPPANDRLSFPVGYPNGLAILAVLAAVLATGVAARAPSLWARGAAAAAVPALSLTLYFTFSRGAFPALAGGLAAALALAPRRLQFAATVAALGLPSAVLVSIASASDALTEGASAGRATADGGRVALLTVVLGAAAAGLVAAVKAMEERLVVGPRGRLTIRALAALAAAAVVALVVVRYGSPGEIFGRAYASFSGPLSPGPTATTRLFEFQGSRRAELWTAALRDFSDHPLAGSGAGTYESYWLMTRPLPVGVRDAHSLYLEALAELGIVGLLVLLAALAAPFAAAVRMRAHPLVPGAAGAYAAYVLHTGVDWDWEMLAVTLAGLSFGAALVVAARRGEPRPASTALRAAWVVPTLGVMAFALAGMAAASATADAYRAAVSKDWARVEVKAREARRFTPWSTEAARLEGDSYLWRKRKAEALVSFRWAVRRDARSWLLWYRIGLASTGEEQRAAARQAARLNPLQPGVVALRRRLASEKTD
jgi:hypothetical protein